MRKIIICLLCLASFIDTNAQDFSNKGKEFWLAYSYHVGMVNAGGQPTMTLFISSDLATTYSVEIYGGLPTVLQTGTINAGQVITVNIPNSYFINDEGVFNNKAIRVSAAKPVVVYSYITRSAASAATVCLPTNVLGKEYYAMSFTQESNEANSNSFITIIAVEDNTTVQIIPSVTTKGGWAAGSINNITLNKGQIYQVLGTTSGNSGGDLTGTIVKSISVGSGGCQRIAVFSGSGKIRIPVPAQCGQNSSDNLYQQLYPTGSWGKKYITVPSYARSNNYYRIARINAAANVTVNGVAVPAASFTNGYYQFQSTVPNVIESDQPICVAQYFTTAGCNGNPNPYDPDMIILNPVEQNINKVTLVSSSLVATPPEHHLHVIMKNNGTAQSSFRFDGNPVPAINWTAVPNDPSYSYLYLSNVTQGFHTLYSDTGFNAIAYGYANAESYGYSAGSNVKDLYQFASVQNEEAIVTFPAACKGSPFYIYQTLPYQPTSITWHFYGAIPGASDTTWTGPVHDSTYVVNGKQVWRYKISHPYVINTPGTYPITVEVVNPTADGCTGLQEIDYDLEVFPPPVADFTWTHTGCVSDTVYFAENSTNTGGRPVYKWRWNFHDGGIDSVKMPKKLYSVGGNFDVKLVVVTDVGCRSETLTKNIAITDTPRVAITISTPRCPGMPITFTSNTTVPIGTMTKWVYNWGDGSPVDTFFNANPRTHSYATAGTYNMIHSVYTSSGCNKALTTPIVINPRPAANFTLPANVCLPEGLATFPNTTTISDGTLPTVTYQWNFGDATPPVNSPPNDGTHNYSAVGPFNVQLIATSANGCKDTSTKVFNNIRPRPTAGFTNNPEICLNDSLQFTSNSTGNGGNITEYHWDFGDATTSTLQNPKKRWATTGTKTVKHWIRTDQGCYSDTLTRTIYVNALPVGDFTFPATNRCDRKAITFTNASTATDGTINQWTWIFGDGSPTEIYNNGNPVQHTYTNPGTYNVKLIVRTDRGCNGDTVTKVVTVAATPVAAFTPPGGICLPSGFAQFINTTTISDGTLPTVTYEWNFGDGSPVVTSPPASASPSHNYSGTGPYTAQLIAIAAAGCRDTTTRNISTIFPQPRANFTSNPEVCLSDSLQFTDASVSNGGTVNEWHWDFGDATTSTLQNPKKRWSTPGTKTVKLWVKTTNGCPSDTMTKTIFVNQLPTASFTVSAIRCERSDITFTSTSVPNDGVLSEWTWDFGDGSPVQIRTNGAPFPYVYATGGTYNVKLTVKTDKGCVSTQVTVPVTVNVRAATNFTLPANVCLPAGAATFTNTTTISDGTLPSVTYQWNFGDPGSGANNTATTTNGSHNYSAVGPFNVQLISTSSNSCKDTSTKVFNNIRPRPTAGFNSNPEICLSDSLQFNDASLGNGGNVVEWNWDFGDATTSTLQNPKKRWATPGTKTIRHWIRTDQGCYSDTITRTIYVNNLPTSDFTISSPRCEGKNITFTDASTPNDGVINAWSWDLGDGATFNTSGPITHAYAAVGTYNASLRVTTDKGCTSAAATVKQVQVYNNPVAKFGLPEACVSDAVQFSDSSSIADGTQSQFTYAWNFGDPGSGASNTSSVKNPTHLFTAAGNYNIRLVVTSNQGCTAQADSAFIVNGAVPVADYTVQTAAPLCGNKEIVIQNTSTVDFGSITKVEIYWDWTNNPLLKTVDDVPTPGKLYNFDYPDFNTPASKTYTIRFLAYSGGTCVSVKTATVTILASPILRFDPVSPICAEEPAIQLTQAAETAGLPGNGVFTGPGMTGNTFNPAVAGVGSHVIRYTYNANNGCTAFREQTIVVNETPNVSAGPDRTVLEGGSVVLLGSSNIPGTSFLWTPSAGLSNANIPQPSASPADDITYTVTGRTAAGCEATDQVFVKLLKGPRIPNAFSPNGDGINDRWEIEFLDTYVGCTVEVYNIYGQIVFRSTGYPTPWDGTFKGKPLPVGTYYYIIEPKNGRSPLTGYVGIVR